MNFDKEAAHFDTDRRRERAVVIAEKIRDYLPNGANAMEFGCGTGLTGLELIGQCASMTFVDSSSAMVDRVREKIKGMDGAQALKLDILKGERIERRFDFIFMSMVLHHIRDISALLKALTALLSENGRVVIVDLDPDDGRFHQAEPDFDGHNGFEHGEILDYMGASGLSNVEIETFYHGEKEVFDQRVRYSLFIAKGERKHGENLHASK